MRAMNDADREVVRRGKNRRRRLRQVHKFAQLLANAFARDGDEFYVFGGQRLSRVRQRVTKPRQARHFRMDRVARVLAKVDIGATRVALGDKMLGREPTTGAVVYRDAAKAGI